MDNIPTYAQSGSALLVLGLLLLLQRFLFCPMSRNHGMQHDLSEGTPWAGIHMISSCTSSGRMCEDVAHKGLMRSTNSPLTLDEFWWAMKKMKMTWNDSKWSQYRWSWTYIMLSGCQAVLLWWVSSNLHLGNPWNQDGVLWTYCLWTVVEVQYMMWFQRWVQSNWKILTLALYDSGRTTPPPCNAMAIYGTPAGFPKVSPVHCHYVSCFIWSFYIPLHILDPTSSPV